MKLSEFIKNCASLSDWHVIGDQLLTPDGYSFSITNIENKHLYGIDKMKWNNVYFPFMLQCAIDNFNKNEMKFNIDINSLSIMIKEKSFAIDINDINITKRKVLEYILK